VWDWFRSSETERIREVSRTTVLYSLAAHVALIVLALIVPSGSARDVSFGGEIVAVEMVTLDPGIALAPDQTDVEDIAPDEGSQDTAEVQEELVEEVAEDVELVEDVEVQPDTAGLEEETQESAETNPAVEELEVVEDDGSQSDSYSAITGEGESGGGAPGPASYEGRVFAAIRRNFRTSVEPAQSYRIRFTVEPDGSTSVETIRTSGTDAFDRAVESALRLASIPPFPQGRDGPVVLSIEFLGPP
jgi:TonB family protein